MKSKPKPLKVARLEDVYCSLVLLMNDAAKYRDGGTLARVYRASLIRIGNQLDRGLR